ncbi:hypothetical protein AB5V95_02085 [Metamycoplasma spumans]|uniref:IdeS/Mac family cysteine endopeptidase n=1 Tax=Metamycoplasma spumans TaxID=92406 RepID=UPI0034DD51CA
MRKNKLLSFSLGSALLSSFSLPLISAMANENNENQINNEQALKNKLKELLNNNPAKDQVEGKYEFAWVNGVEAPDISQFKIEDSYIYGVGENGQNWYDANKKITSGSLNDIYLCYAAVAANYLHWFYNQNQDNIKKFYEFEFNKKSGKDFNELNTYNWQEGRSGFFEYFKGLLSGRPARGDQLINMMLNGYNYGKSYWDENNLSPNGSYFVDVFKNVKMAKFEDSLAYKENGELGYSDINKLGNDIKKAISEGKALALSYRVNTYGHIISVWGADYKDGVLSGIYVTDSDDATGSEIKQKMKRYNITTIDNKVVISNNFEQDGTNKIGTEIWGLHSYNNGKKEFDEYFKSVEKNPELYIQKYQERNKKLRDKINSDTSRLENSVAEIKQMKYFDFANEQIVYADKQKDINNIDNYLSEVKKYLEYAFEPRYYSFYISKSDAIINEYRNKNNEIEQLLEIAKNKSIEINDIIKKAKLANNADIKWENNYYYESINKSKIDEIYNKSVEILNAINENKFSKPLSFYTNSYNSMNFELFDQDGGLLIQGSEKDLSKKLIEELNRIIENVFMNFSEDDKKSLIKTFEFIKLNINKITEVSAEEYQNKLIELKSSIFLNSLKYDLNNLIDQKIFEKGDEVKKLAFIQKADNIAKKANDGLSIYNDFISLKNELNQSNKPNKPITEEQHQNSHINTGYYVLISFFIVAVFASIVFIIIKQKTKYKNGNKK